MTGDDWWKKRSRVAAKQIKKQANRLRYTETDKHLARKYTRGRKRHRRKSLLAVDTSTQRVKQKIKNEAPYVLFVLLLLK